MKGETMSNNRVLINLNNIDDIKKFSKIVTNFNEDIDILSGRFVVDAKSIMGIFALDLSKPVEVEILTDSEEVFNKFKESISEFSLK
jgi:phosphotransferase system HPr-like phosphotransfer protein